VKDKIYLSVDKKLQGDDIQVTILDLLGKQLCNASFKLNGSDIEIPIPDVHERMIILIVKGRGSSFRQLVLIDQ
jgi:hypothetical protein